MKKIKNDKYPRVSIIIANFNGLRWFDVCMSSIRNQTYKNIEIIIVDNGSSDGSVQYISHEFPECKVLINKNNLGYGQANNLGVKLSTGEYLFFLNNDTELNPDTISKLIEFCENNNVDITGPQIYDFSGKDIYAGKTLSIDFTGYLGWGKKTFFIEGCGLVIKKKIFLSLGMFDKDYFMYSEDIDLCWRALIAGYKVELCKSAQMRHYGGGSSSDTNHHKNLKYVAPLFRRFEAEKNNLSNLIKNYEFKNLLWVTPLFFAQGILESIFYLLTNNSMAAKQMFKAYVWHLQNIKTTLKKRKVVQDKRTISDSMIFPYFSRWPSKLYTLIIVGIPKYI